MKITKLRTQVVEFPYAPPIELFDGLLLRSSSCVLIFLESDQGEIGEGLVYAFNGQRIKIYEDMVRSFEALVVGANPVMAGAIFANVWSSARSFGQSGFITNAIAGIDMALWDLRGKLAGLNVAALIGQCRKTIPVYNSGGYWLPLTLDELQSNAAKQMQQGFRAFKLRINGDIAKSVARVQAMREVIGPDMSLLVDVNQATTVNNAIRLGRALEHYNLTWLEEPVISHDHVSEAKIAAALDTPIASGESVYTSRGILQMLKLEAADVVMPDLMHMGGPTEFLKAANYAEAFNIPCSNHFYTEMSIALLAAIPNAPILEYLSWLEPIYRERIELDKDGRAIIPITPGWGFSFDSHAVQKYSSAL